jgi:sulfatase modifying factor 1
VSDTPAPMRRAPLLASFALLVLAAGCGGGELDPATEQSAVSGGDWGRCEVRGVAGTCKAISACGGRSTPGYCPGPNTIRCCTEEDAGDPTPSAVTCAVGGAAGECRSVASCPGTATPGYCPGPADIQCCTPTGDPSTPPPEPTPTSCAVGGVSGQCVSVSSCAGVSTPGRCPGPADIQCCTADPCRPAVDPNLGVTEAPGVGGCPAGSVPVADFCVDRFEAALVEQHPDGTETPWSPYLHPGRRAVRAISAAGAVPQGYIDGVTAARACARAGKRLCTDGEWLRACRGARNSTYPYGDRRQGGTCNDARATHPAVELFGDRADPFAHLDSACINQLPDSLARTGANPGCVSADGLYDMMGNLHEWTADPAGTFRGGYYVDTVRNGEGCLYRTTAHDMGYSDYSTGFRCCADR